MKEQADKLKTTLEQVKLIPPVDLKPFVYVRISEHPDIPLEEAMPLNQAVELFGKLDRQAVEEKDMAGYYKTHFEICFLSEGEVMSYTGRQDFGDGEGNLLDHVKAFADYYLHTKEGQQLMKQTARTTEEWEHEQQQNEMGTGGDASYPSVFLQPGKTGNSGSGRTGNRKESPFTDAGGRITKSISGSHACLYPGKQDCIKYREGAALYAGYPGFCNCLSG